MVTSDKKKMTRFKKEDDIMPLRETLATKPSHGPQAVGEGGRKGECCDTKGQF